MKKNVIISPIYKNYMAGRIWMGLDVKVIEKEFKNLGWNTQIINFNHLINHLGDIPNEAIIFYSTIYNENYLKYIQDTILFLKEQRPDINLIPSFKQLYALENKGYQEYMKKELGIKRVEGRYYGDINELIQEDGLLEYPFVLKENRGALSSGVHLIASYKDLIKLQNSLKKKTFRENVTYRMNKRNSFNRDKNLNPPIHLLENNFEDFFQKRTPVIKQEYIPNLKYDFKVLQFGDKYYCLKRFTRKNDFRASGSGKTSFEEAPDKVLDYAKTIVEKLKTPFVSLDIGIDDNNCYLFEFQGTGFGPLTLTQSKFYYIFENNEWKKIEEPSNLEAEYVLAIHHFITNNLELNPSLY